MVARPFAALRSRGQTLRRSRPAAAVLAAWGLEAAPLRLLAQRGASLFRVDAPAGRYVLRLYGARSPSTAQIRSELLWLRALGTDAGLMVPEPVATPGGDLVVEARDPAVPEPCRAGLQRWVPCPGEALVSA